MLHLVDFKLKQFFKEKSTPTPMKVFPAISSEPVQFQVNSCNFKCTRAISSNFKIYCMISVYGVCIVVGNSL